MRKLLFGVVAALVLATSVDAQRTGYQNWSNIHSVGLKADFTDANASGAQAIPALLMTFPAGFAATYQVDCDIFLSQATAAADSINAVFAGNSPSNAELGGIAATNATAFAAGTPANITSTSTAVLVTFTPAVATVLYAHVGGMVEIASNALDTTLQMQILQGTAANVIVVKRGSVCRWSEVV